MHHKLVQAGARGAGHTAEGKIVTHRERKGRDVQVQNT